MWLVRYYSGNQGGHKSSTRWCTHVSPYYWYMVAMEACVLQSVYPHPTATLAQGHMPPTVKASDIMVPLAMIRMTILALASKTVTCSNTGPDTMNHGNRNPHSGNDDPVGDESDDDSGSSFKTVTYYSQMRPIRLTITTIHVTRQAIPISGIGWRPKTPEASFEVSF
ncbi:hypothetical protein BASA83_010460 [Batrachochytrium salamandrivorans]|nr:hypothetical protein BASA83_010460 [Batrachochytrium salamandrivorans]